MFPEFKNENYFVSCLLSGRAQPPLSIVSLLILWSFWLMVHSASMSISQPRCIPEWRILGSWQDILWADTSSLLLAISEFSWLVFSGITKCLIGNMTMGMAAEVDCGLRRLEEKLTTTTTKTLGPEHVGEITCVDTILTGNPRNNQILESSSNQRGCLRSL